MLQKEIYNNIFNKKANVVNEENKSFHYKQIFKALSLINREMAGDIKDLISTDIESRPEIIDDLVYGLQENLTKSLDLLQQIKL